MGRAPVDGQNAPIGADIVIVSALSAWAPGVETYDQWLEWAEGKRQIKQSTDAPSLKGFTTSLFRRRMSQISRMTIQVVHDTVEMAKAVGGVDEGGADGMDWVGSVPMVFVSNRGELARELSVSRMLVADHEVLPASFSLSVFNTPIALSAIALGLHGAYTAVYPADGNFNSAFMAASSQIVSGECQNVLVAYADEAVPAEYASLPDAAGADGKPLEPLAFAFVISAQGALPKQPYCLQSPIAPLLWSANHIAINPSNVPASSEDFLRHLLLNMKDISGVGV